MIAPDSSSYPILGAARAAGVDYGLALRLVEWSERRVRAGRPVGEANPFWDEGVARFGLNAMIDLAGGLYLAMEEGRLRSNLWPRP